VKLAFLPGELAGDVLLSKVKKSEEQGVILLQLLQSITGPFCLVRCRDILRPQRSRRAGMRLVIGSGVRSMPYHFPALHATLLNHPTTDRTPQWAGLSVPSMRLGLMVVRPYGGSFLMTTRLQYGENTYEARRIICLTVILPYDQGEYDLDETIDAKVVKLIDGIGKNCRVSKFQWLVSTDEPCGAIVQDLSHEGVQNVFAFSALVGTDWRFQCRPQGETDASEFDGIAAFLQQLD